MSACSTEKHKHAWLDKLAISMSMLCAVHCLITPVLLVALPILSTTIWVDKDFHLWMIGLVIPTTTLAMFMGCKKHKDKWVAIMSALALTILFSLAIYEAFFVEAPHCEACAGEASIWNAVTFLNLFGGALLASSHVRNFLLCKSTKCSH